jgi:hypothetical protein
MGTDMIFRREPATWLAFVAVVVKLATAFGLDLTVDQQSAVNAIAAAIVGLAVAAMVHDGIGAAAMGFIQAAVALAVGFGLHWSPGQQSVVMAFAAALVAMWTRTQVVAPVPAGALPSAKRLIQAP